ncbi:MAG: hypothetical protein HY093_00730 [Candidatus Liptonbacteria bacterium]|nr:hypothetical protein [Candidatus Liptonbacteria bacterium]
MSPATATDLTNILSPLNLEIATLIGLFALAFILFQMAEQTLLFWRREDFKKKLKWILLEINMPRETLRNPKAMEQVLASIHALRNEAYDLAEYYRDGEVTRWFSLEMVSFGGEVHFYVRLYYKYRALVEAAFYSYYQDVELVEVEDYLNRFPSNVEDMYSKGYELWGTEMVLNREEAYPIKTYPFFESPDENKEYDPISAFLEVLAKVKKQEMVGIQLLLEADTASWKDEWEELVEKLKQTKARREAQAHLGGVETTTTFPGGPLPVFTTEKPETDALDLFAKSLTRSPGETDVLKAVETNLSKPAFKTTVRFIYFSPKLMFYDSFARRGLVGAFNQYSALDLNSFRQNIKVSTRLKFWTWPFFFAQTRNRYRKQRLLYNYLRWKQPQKTFWAKILSAYHFNFNFASKPIHLNIESIATLFHPPSQYVLVAPHVKRVESRKAGPPAGLAIFGEEEKIEKFL